MAETQYFLAYRFLWFLCKNESAAIAASIDAMAAGEDAAEASGSKNASDDSPSVRWQLCVS